MKKWNLLVAAMGCCLLAGSAFGGSDPVLAAEGDGLGASAACEGYTLGQFNGQPACVDGDGNLHLCAENFPSDVFRNYLSWYIVGGEDGLLTIEEVSRVESLTITEHGEYGNICGIEFLPSLKTLDCEWGGLTELNVSGNLTLTELYCGFNDFTILDLSSNPNLQVLTGYWNDALTSLNLEGCTNLRDLALSDNRALTSLDLSSCPNLVILVCDGAGITELDLSHCPKLESLNCDRTDISRLDFSNNPNVRAISCMSTGNIPFIDVTGLPLTYAQLGGGLLYLDFQQEGENWVADLSQVIDADKLDRVTLSSDGTYDPETGLVTFDYQPSDFVYLFDTGSILEGSGSYYVTVQQANLDHEHDFGSWYDDWIVVTPATPETDGLEVRLCSICGAEDHRTIPAFGYITGDTDGDGQVNIQDVSLMQRFLADWDVACYAENMDFNNDGATDMRDLALFQRQMVQ